MCKCIRFCILNNILIIVMIYFIFWTVLLLHVAASIEFKDIGNPYTEILDQRPWESDQRYVEVRRGAFTFYWLYFADGSRIGAHTKPLIIWIQGGPGLAASGLANFAEIGPLDMNFLPRNHTWVKGRNVLLIDHPVGTGFSYVKDPSLHAKNDRMMAADLYKTIKAFFRRYKDFRKTPTYVIGQSYGGKLCPRLALHLHTAIQKKKVKMNFKGIGIGGGWVNPKESTIAMVNFLYYSGTIDLPTHQKCTAIIENVVQSVDKRNYLAATDWDDKMYMTIGLEAGTTINYNNINRPSPYSNLDKLAKKVNMFVKPTLKIVNQNLTWSYFSEEIYHTLKGDFFLPSTKFLEALLNRTELNIAVYNGNLDIITPLAGATNWVHKLRWNGAEDFKNAERVAIPGNGFHKKFGRFSFWWVFGAGHWIPEDNPEVMKQILDHLITIEE